MTIDASGSSDPDGIVTLEWDCEGDGVYEEASDWSVPAARAYTCTYMADGTYEPSARATNSLVRHVRSLCPEAGMWFMSCLVSPLFCVSCAIFYDCATMFSCEMFRLDGPRAPVC